MNHDDLEHTLKTMRWRNASPAFLRRSLDAAIAERKVAVIAPRDERSAWPGEGHALVNHASSSTTSAEPLASRSLRSRTRLVTRSGDGYSSRVLRLALAACWLLALFFKLTTPDSVSPQTREAIAHMPPVDPALLLAKLEDEKQLIATLLADLESQRQARLSSKPSLLP